MLVMALSSTTLLACAFFLALALYGLYRGLLPRPIPEIPYNKANSQSLLGDAGAFIKTGRLDPHTWFTEQCIALDSPIIQLFMGPFRKPWVIVADFQEANDIMTRRTREFDRSDFFGVGTFCSIASLPHECIWRPARNLSNLLRRTSSFRYFQISMFT